MYLIPICLAHLSLFLSSSVYLRQHLGEMEIGDLESKWDSPDVLVDENNMDAVNVVVEGSGAKAAAVTVHMELFYNGQEKDYNGSVHDENSANKVGYAC